MWRILPQSTQCSLDGLTSISPYLSSSRSVDASDSGAVLLMKWKDVRTIGFETAFLARELFSFLFKYAHCFLLLTFLLPKIYV